MSSNKTPSNISKSKLDESADIVTVSRDQVELTEGSGSSLRNNEEESEKKLSCHCDGTSSEREREDLENEKSVDVKDQKWRRRIHSLLVYCQDSEDVTKIVKETMSRRTRRSIYIGMAMSDVRKEIRKYFVSKRN